MKPWLARVLALAFAAAAIYLVVLNMHAARVPLEGALGAAIICMLGVVLLWRVPAAAAILNLICVGAALYLTFAQHGTPAAATRGNVAAVPSNTAPAATNAWQTSDASRRAATEQVVPTSVLGTAQVDDGIVTLESYATKSTSAVGSAAAAFGSAAPATPNPGVASARALEAAVPASEYNLDKLADTLPNDPVAIYRFVRDRVGSDVYSGSMRGPLGAWMGRSGNSADKSRLLAWLLAKKNVAARFERGTLSNAERAQVLDEASSSPRTIQPPKDGDTAGYVNALAAAGAAFASWASAKLAAANVTVGTGAIDASHVPVQHYWIRAYAGGKQIDLDPTLRAMNEGQHLGTTDPSFKETPTFPVNDTMHVRVRLIASTAGAETMLAEGVGAIPDLAYAPLVAGVVPDNGNPNVLQTSIVLGFDPKNGKPISASQLPDKLILQVDRADGAGATVTVRRTIFDRSTAGSNPAQAIAGIHTIVLAPGSAPMLFAYETFRDIRVLTENAAAQAAGAKKPFAGLYPALLAAFYQRDDTVASTLGDRNGVRLFRDRPDLVMLHTTGNGSGGSPSARTVFDIADNGMSAVGSTPALASANLARGWADAWIESDLLSRGGGAMTAWLANKKTASYSVVKNAPDNLSAADVAIVAAGGTPQWWDVEPSSASVVGRIPGGWGGSVMGEYMTIMREMQAAYEAFEIEQTAKACFTSGGEGCAEELCNLAISGTLAVRSVGEAEFKAGVLVAEVVFGKTLGVGCGALGGSEGHGGEPGNGGGEPGNGGGEPPGNGGGDPPCMCSTDPNPSDGNGP